MKKSRRDRNTQREKTHAARKQRGRHQNSTLEMAAWKRRHEARRSRGLVRTTYHKLDSKLALGDLEVIGVVKPTPSTRLLMVDHQWDFEPRDFVGLPGSPRANPALASAIHNLTECGLIQPIGLSPTLDDPPTSDDLRRYLFPWPAHHCLIGT